MFCASLPPAKSDSSVELRGSSSQFVAAQVVGVRSSSSLSCGGAVAAAAAATATDVVLSFGRNLALLALLLLHEQVDQHDLLLVDLQANVFRDVGDYPVYDVAHQHDDVLWTETESKRMQ